MIFDIQAKQMYIVYEMDNDKDYDEIQDDYDVLQSGKKAKISKLSSKDEEA